MTMRPLVAVAAGLMAVLTGLAALPATAGAQTHDWEHGTTEGGAFQTGSFNDDALGYPCTAYAGVFMRELGVSGITRLRIHFELYGAYTPLYLPSKRSTREMVYPLFGQEFADDAENHWLAATLPWGLWKEASGERVVADYVGERPSLWKPDIHEEVEIGTINCDGSDIIACQATAVGLQSCARHVTPNDVTGRGGIDGADDVDQDGVRDDTDPYVTRQNAG